MLLLSSSAAVLWMCAILHDVKYNCIGVSHISCTCFVSLTWQGVNLHTGQVRKQVTSMAKQYL